MLSIALQKELPPPAPYLVNNDPFGKGWLVKIRVDNLSMLNQLMDSMAYDQIVVGQ